MRDVPVGEILMGNKRTPPSTRIKNLTLAAIAGQAGCLTLTIVLLALFIGLWLDSRLGQRGPCTLGLLVLSIPVSLYLMLRFTINTLNRVSTQAIPKRNNPIDELEED
jgi:hypothetical protein